jgi:enoyl-CoA hydratase/carnithine racemase
MTSEDQAVPESVLVEYFGAIRILTLNRAEKLNAADLNMQYRVPECLKTIQADSEARVLIITGAGRAFSSGADRSVVSRRYAPAEDAFREELHAVYASTVVAMLDLTIPIIAAVHGPAIGWGAALVALADFVVMSEDAFICEPHVKLGVCETTCRVVWPHLTSYAVAKELLMLGREVGAKEALRLGLANRVTPTGEDLTTAIEVAQTFLALPQAGVAAVKRPFNAQLLDEFFAVRNQKG